MMFVLGLTVVVTLSFSSPTYALFDRSGDTESPIHLDMVMQLDSSQPSFLLPNTSYIQDTPEETPIDGLPLVLPIHFSNFFSPIFIARILFLNSEPSRCFWSSRSHLWWRIFL